MTNRKRTFQEVEILKHDETEFALEITTKRIPTCSDDDGSFTYIPKEIPFAQTGSGRRQTSSFSSAEPEPEPSPAPEAKLSAKQQEMFDVIVNQRKDAFVTGSAGTGKSLLLTRIVQALQEAKRNVAVTATTGVAAYNVSGVTFHGFLGVGVDLDKKDDMLKIIHGPNNAKKRKMFQSLELLIVDEISMAHEEYLEAADFLLRTVRKRPLDLFGGVRLVVFGDFCQLPPVNPKLSPFLFMSKIWKSWKHKQIQFTKSFRQENQEYVDFLTRMRLGEMTEQDFEKIKGKCVDKVDPEEKGVTHIYCRNLDVDQLNAQKMNKLDVTTKHVYRGTMLFVSGQGRSEEIKMPQSKKDYVSLPSIVPRDISAQVLASVRNTYEHARARDNLELRTGALVVLLINLDVKVGLTHGTCGTVVGFDKDENPIVEFVTKETTITKSVSKAMFPTKFGKSGVLNWIQTPLRACWAVTVHKSQGLTLRGKCIIDAGSGFASGQMYVAFSRCTDWDNIRILNFDRKSIFVDQRVVKFYQSMGKDTIEDGT